MPVAYHGGHVAVIVAAGAESHLEVLQLKGDALEASGVAPPSVRVQDAVYDAQGVLWMVDEAGVMYAPRLSQRP